MLIYTVVCVSMHTIFYNHSHCDYSKLLVNETDLSTKTQNLGKHINVTVNSTVRITLMIRVMSA